MPTNAQIQALRNERNRLERESRAAVGRGWLHGAGSSSFGPTAARSYSTGVAGQLRAANNQLRRALAARQAANEMRAAARAAAERRRTRLAKVAAGRWHQRAHRPSNVRNVGGIAFLRSAVRTAVGDDVLRRLRRQLLELRELRPANNSRRMRNIFNDMSKRWNSANNELAAANVMNAAQKVMNRAGLLSLSARRRA